MKLLLNCDHVFEVLTRGPFPTGEPTDEAVEMHLAACHECRQLAEALRPAVALFHEAVSKEESLELPEYQGTLPEPDPFEHDMRPVDPELQFDVRLRNAAGWRASPRKLALRGQRRTRPARQVRQSKSWDTTLINAARLIAASVLVVALGWLAWGLTAAPRDPAAAAATPQRAPDAGSISFGGSKFVSLDKQGLSLLAGLKLPDSCLPLRAVGITRLAAADALQCCTECHRVGTEHSRVAGVERFSQACAACHRG